MKWLVTGGLGFIGSHFIEEALARYPYLEIVNLDAKTYAAGACFVSNADAGRYQFLHGSITEAYPIRRIINSVDKIINFAAETHVDRSIRNPQDFVHTNILGTERLLALAQLYDIKQFVQISTDEVYGSNPFSKPSVESDHINPSSPYSASKAAAEFLVLAYYKTYGLNVVITRGCNTYGPRQYPEKLVPLFINKILNGEKVPMYGDGKNIRQWIHVKDHVDAILRVIEVGHSGEAYNVAGTTSLTNVEMARTLAHCCGVDANDGFIEYIEDRPGHDRKYYISGGKLAHPGGSFIGWEPKIPFVKGIEETVAWYKANQ